MNGFDLIVPVSGCSSFEDHCRGKVHEQQCILRPDAMQGDLISEIQDDALAWRRRIEGHAFASDY